MKNIALFLLLISVAITKAAQPFKPVEWDKTPVYQTLPDTLKDENVVMLKLNVRYDFRHDEEGNLCVYQTEHQIVRVLNEDAIDDFNTYSVSDNEVLEWITLKARTISETGKITQFDKNNIKEITDEETGNPYKIFAVDGIEVGNTIEFLSVKKKTASSFNRNYFQFYYPLLKSVYTLTCPLSLQYQVKGFNGYMEQVENDVQDSLRIVCWEGANIPTLYDEPFSYRNSQRVRVEYRLDRNFNSGKYQLLTWDNAAQRVYNNNYAITEKENKALAKYVSAMKIITGTDGDKIRFVEQYLKKNILIQENGGDENDELESVIKNQVASAKGITKLFANIFNSLHIQHEIVLTIEREKVRFDKDFQNWNNLDEFLIYFPKEDLFMEPAANAFRLGMISSLLTAQNGLFVRPVSVGDFTSAVGDIRYIKETSSDDNYDHIYVDVSLNDALDNATIQLERSFKGVSGGNFGYILESRDESQKEQLLKSLSGMDDFKPDFSNFEVLEKSKKPTASDAQFSYSCTLKTPSVLENAGNKILVQLGKLIGPQAELYQEEERQNDVENFFNRSYYRELVFTVPDGYKISNPEAVNFQIVQVLEGDTINAFLSDAELDNNVFKVRVNEYYNQLIVPKKDFEGFRKVVNAAADFNKVVLLLEKN